MLHTSLFLKRDGEGRLAALTIPMAMSLKVIFNPLSQLSH